MPDPTCGFVFFSLQTATPLAVACARVRKRGSQLLPPKDKATFEHIPTTLHPHHHWQLSLCGNLTVTVIQDFRVRQSNGGLSLLWVKTLSPGVLLCNTQC